MVRSVTLSVLVCLAGAVAALSQTPAVPPGGVVDAAAGSSPVAPGALVSIFGSNLASALAVANSVPISTSLGNVSVTFNGIAAPLLFVSTGQVNAQLPWDVLSSGTVGTANMVVTSNGQASPSVSVAVGPFSPGIFSSGTQAIAYGNSDGIIAAAPGAIPGLTTHPAKVNDPLTLVILATGLGAVNPAVQTGSNVTDGLVHNTATLPTVTVGNTPAQVVFSGMSPQFVGVYQINATVPAKVPQGLSIPLVVNSGGVSTTLSVLRPIEPVDPRMAIRFMSKKSGGAQPGGRLTASRAKPHSTTAEVRQRAGHLLCQACLRAREEASLNPLHPRPV